MTCTCNVFNVEVSGGLVCGGESTSADTIVRGGIVCSGTARVDVLQDPYDQLEALWPMDGGPETWRDLGRWALDGTSDNGPDLVTGVFCLPAADFTGDNFEYVTIPADTLDSQPMSVTFWCQVSEQYRPRCLFSRGYDDTTGAKWVMTIGYGWLCHVVVAIQSDDGETVEEAYSTTTLELGRNYHVGVVIVPGDRIDIYINGELDSTTEITITDLMPLGSAGGLGQWQLQSHATARLQEVRLYPDAKSAAWMEAERHNFCDPDFVTVTESS